MSIMERKINYHGRDFINLTTGQTTKAVLHENTAMFPHSSGITPGQVLQDALSGWQYIASDMINRPECLYVPLARFHLVATISRTSTDLNPYGRHISAPVTLFNAVPIIFNTQQHAEVPAGHDIQQGDTITVDSINESYQVKALAPGNLPGLNVLNIAQ